MKYYVYSIFDKKLEVFEMPQIKEIEKDRVATQTIRAVKSDPKSCTGLDGKQLVYLGTYDDETGKFEQLEVAEVIVDFTSLLVGE